MKLGNTLKKWLWYQQRWYFDIRYALVRIIINMYVLCMHRYVAVRFWWLFFRMFFSIFSAAEETVWLILPFILTIKSTYTKLDFKSPIHLSPALPTDLQKKISFFLFSFFHQVHNLGGQIAKFLTNIKMKAKKKNDKLSHCVAKFWDLRKLISFSIRIQCWLT